MNISIERLNKNLTEVINRAILNNKVITVNTKKGNVVIISEEQYNSLCETVYLCSQPGLVKSIKKAAKEDISTMKEYSPSEEW